MQQQDTATRDSSLQDEARHARVGGGERDVEGVVHGRDDSCQRRGLWIHGREVDHGCDDASLLLFRGRGATARRRLLGVALDDSVAGRLASPSRSSRDARCLSTSTPRKFLEVGAELSRAQITAAARDDDSSLLLFLVEEPCGCGGCRGEQCGCLRSHTCFACQRAFLAQAGMGSAAQDSSLSTG